MRIGNELEYFCTTSRRVIAFSVSGNVPLLTAGGIGEGDTFLSFDLQSSGFLIASSEVAALSGASGLSGSSGGGLSSIGSDSQ